MTDEEQWGHNFARHLESDDEDDYDYRNNRGDTYTVTLFSLQPLGLCFLIQETNEYLFIQVHFDSNDDLYSKIRLYQKSLQPVLESYVVTIGELKSLLNKQILHSELSKQIFSKLKNSFENDQLNYRKNIIFSILTD